MFPKLLVWTATDEKAVKRTAQGFDAYYKDKIVDSPSKLDRLAYTLAAKRSRMLWRTFATVTADGLEGTGPNWHESLCPAKPIRSSSDRGLAFVFTGQGAQYVDMGWDLIQYPVFSETLHKVDEVFKSLGCSWSIFGKGTTNHFLLPLY